MSDFDTSTDIPGQPNLQPDLRQSIDSRINAVNQLSGDYEKDAGKAGGFTQLTPKQYDLGQQGQQGAIQQLAQQKFYDPEVQRLQVMQKANYAQVTQQKMLQAQQQGVAELRYDNARALAMHQRTAMEEAQRAQLLQGVFGLGGAAAGAALGGAPGGMAGGAAGRMAGGGIADANK